MPRKNALWLAVAAGVGVGLTARQFLRGDAGIDLFGKVALIVGGTRGLGLAAARLFGAEGCRIAICGRDAAELEQARQDLAGRGIDALALRSDITDCAQAEGMAGAALERYGRIDILVNCTAALQSARPGEVSLADFERAMDEMFWSTVYPIRAVLPHMLERRFGRIVNVAAAVRPSAPSRRVAWECAELAATGLSRGLRKELAPEGIMVAAVTPDAGMSLERAARHVVGAAQRGQGSPAPHNGNGHGHSSGGPAWRWALSLLGRTAARRYL